MNSQPTQFAPGQLRRIQLDHDGRRLEFDGLLLAVASSQKLTHNHDGPSAPPGRTCSACRWVEVTLYRRRVPRSVVGPNESFHDHDYVLFTVGRSIVAGEHDIPRLVETSSPYEVVEALTVRRAPGGDRPAEVFMPPQHQ